MGDKMSIHEQEIEQLIKYLRGELSSKDATELKRKIADNPTMQNLVAMINDKKRDCAEIDWEKMKSPVHNLLDLQLKQIKSRRKTGGGRRGITTYDSKLLPLPDGVRPAEVDTRRLKFQIDDAQLEISLYPISPNSYELIGLLSGQDENEKIVVVLKGKGAKLTESANQFGLFRFPRVPQGRYELKIKKGRSVFAGLQLDL